MSLPLVLGRIDRNVARALLHAEVDGAAGAPERAEAVVEFVAARIRSAPAAVRGGVRVVAVALALAVLGLQRVRLDDAAPADVVRVLRPWTRWPLPGVTEYVRLVRSLVVVGWYDGAGVAGVIP